VLTIWQVQIAVALSTMLEMPYFKLRISTLLRSFFSTTSRADRTIVTVVTCHICCFSVTEYAILYTGFSHTHILSMRDTYVSMCAYVSGVVRWANIESVVLYYYPLYILGPCILLWLLLLPLFNKVLLKAGYNRSIMANYVSKNYILIISIIIIIINTI
jgi:hypothetical protein